MVKIKGEEEELLPGILSQDDIISFNFSLLVTNPICSVSGRIKAYFLLIASK